jgi:hypothetical protein
MGTQASPPPQFSPPTLAIRDRALDPAIIETARAWAVVVDVDPAPNTPGLAGVFLRCCKCGQGVARLSWGVPPGRWTPLHATVQELEAGVLAHCLQVHRPLIDPEWSGT